MRQTFGPGSPPLLGDVHVPGDKSLSHRAVLFSAMAEGTTELHGVLDAADVNASVHAVRALGAHVELAPAPDGSLVGTIRGWGGGGPRTPHQPIDCGNSGTTARLLMGILAGWPVQATLVGDESLSRRPMNRVTEPLTRMGVSFEMSEQGTLPITMHRCAAPTPLEYVSPVASAQVKTAVLLAGLRANGRTSVREPALSRDHTERLLPAFGVPVDVDPVALSAAVEGPVLLHSPGTIAVPRDPSSAAFVVAAALLVPGSRVRLPGVSLNHTRTGFLSVLERMGAHIHVVPFPEAGNERVGEIDVRYSPSMSGTVVSADEIPSLVDEIPILALVASQIAGETRFESVGELRVKESDRFSAIIDGLGKLGAEAFAEGETLVVRGGAALHGASLESLGDHRLAMTWAVAGLVAAEPVAVGQFDCVDVSYPRFAVDLAAMQSATAPPRTRDTIPAPKSTSIERDSRLMIIAIDGPAGSGKSTVAKLVASRLGFHYLDTGAMYRAVAFRALSTGVPLDDEDALAAIAATDEVAFGRELGEALPTLVSIAGIDVTEEIRTPEIDDAVSAVARLRRVREAMVAQQRHLAESSDSVVEGRDIGTVVFPNAELKVYLTASPEERARRRAAQQAQAGIELTATDVKESLIRRDEADSNRDHSPLASAPDAVELDTTGLSLDEVVERVAALARERSA